MRNQNGVLGHIAGGWQFSWYSHVQTGLPLTATIANGGCASGTGAGCVDPMGSACFGSTPVGCRVNQLGDPNGNAPHTYTQWFNHQHLACRPQPKRSFQRTSRRNPWTGFLEYGLIGVQREVHRKVDRATPTGNVQRLKPHEPDLLWKTPRTPAPCSTKSPQRAIRASSNWLRARLLSQLGR